MFKALDRKKWKVSVFTDKYYRRNKVNMEE